MNENFTRRELPTDSVHAAQPAPSAVGARLFDMRARAQRTRSRAPTSR